MKYYLCCGNKTGVASPAEWLGIDTMPPCDRLADIRTIDVLPDAEIIFATPPCGSFTDLPWKPATNTDLDVLLACLRLCKQAPEWLLENNRWAQQFIGPASFHRGPHYFWTNMLVPVPEFTHYKSGHTGATRKGQLQRAALPVIIY